MLTKRLDNSFKYKDVEIQLTIPFNNVLLFFKLLEDESFDNVEKVEIGFNLLCECDNENELSIADKDKILKIVSNNYIDFIPTNKAIKGNNNKKNLDFNKDSCYIYASFMSEYKIDLYEEMDKLDWRKFISLFYGLSEKTVIKNIMSIRDMKIPKRDKNNSKQIEDIMRMKMLYKLEEDKETREQRFADSIRNFANKFV